MNKNKGFGGLGIILVIVLGVIIVSGGAYFLGKNSSKQIINNQTPIDNSQTVVEPNQVLPVSVNSNSTEKNTVLWHKPMLITNPDIFSHISSANSTDLNDIRFVQNAEKNSSFYSLGTIQSGKYKSDDIVLVKVPSDSPGVDWAYTKLIVDNGTYIMFTNGLDTGNPSPENFGFDSKKVSVDSTYVIPELAAPEKITDSKTNVKFVNTDIYEGKHYDNRRVFYFDSNGLKLAFTDPVWGPIYTTPDDTSTIAKEYKTNGFYLPLPDGNMAVYKISFDYVNPITWNDGTKNTASYSYVADSGCGSPDYADVIHSGVNSTTDLYKTGVTNTYEPIYELKDKNNSLLKDFYSEIISDSNYSLSSKKMTYTEYIASHPLLFYVDSYGRIIRFHNNNIYFPAGGCGKPVIYLYPTNEEKVSVTLDPRGGFTKTEPLYKNGWNVIAKPDGELTNLADNKTYPYLFWEGRGGLYEIPDKGWVISKADVHNFLVSKLADLGLNKKETADFIEFWEPRMQGFPYYFVTFMGNNTMDELAPLSVTPKADTIIRILMDFKSLDKPIKVEPFDIYTPIRKGFTVVEWGGVLR